PPLEPRDCWPHRRRRNARRHRLSLGREPRRPNDPHVRREEHGGTAGCGNEAAGGRAAAAPWSFADRGGLGSTRSATCVELGPPPAPDRGGGQPRKPLGHT